MGYIFQSLFLLFFITFLFFHQMIAFQKLWTMFFFQLKSSHSWDIQIFVIISLPNFSDSKGQMEEQTEME